jgi:hypothetical protein
MAIAARNHASRVRLFGSAARREDRPGSDIDLLVDEEFRSRHPGIPWRDIIGLRVVLARHYHRVDPGQVWVIAATEVPRLAVKLTNEITSSCSCLISRVDPYAGQAFEWMGPRTGRRKHDAVRPRLGSRERSALCRPH